MHTNIERFLNTFHINDMFVLFGLIISRKFDAHLIAVYV